MNQMLQHVSVGHASHHTPAKNNYTYVGAKKKDTVKFIFLMLQISYNKKYKFFFNHGHTRGK